MKRRNVLLLFGILVLVAVIAVVATADVVDDVPEETGTRGATDNSYMDSATYVGSESCEGCHPAKYDTWKDSLHNKKVRLAEAANVTGDFSIDAEISGLGTIDLYYNATADTYHATVGATNYTIKWALGSGYWKQRYMVEIGASTYVLPIQYNTATQEWVAYHAEHWDDVTGNTTSFQNSWERRCMGCHSTGYEVEQNPGGEWVGTYSELNAACESCHGPGSEHVNPPSGEDRTDYIWLDYTGDTCSLCHVRGTSTDGNHGYPNGMMPGDDIFDYYEMEPGNWGDEGEGIAANTSKKHHQQWNDWYYTNLTNGHGQEGDGRLSYFARPGRESCMSCRTVEGFLDEIGQWDREEDVPAPEDATWSQTCISCHDSHNEADQTPYEHQLRVDIEEACTVCHTYGERAVTQSPHHAQAEVFNGTTVADVPGERMMLGEVTCSDCHMPKVAKSAVNYDISSHTFLAIEPEDGIEYDMPDSCTVACHTTMTQENAQEIIDTWHHRFEEHFEEAEEIFHDADVLRDAALENGTISDALNLSFHKANFNLHLSEYGAEGIHNPNFLEDLLNDVIEKSEEVIEGLSKGTIKGTIMDGTDPVAGVYVVAGDGGDITDSNGMYEIEVFTSVMGEKYSIKAYVGDYGIYESAEMVEVPPGQEVTHDIALDMDTDNDGIPDSEDTDDDNDGVPDETDAFDDDPTEWTDTDGDGTGDNEDTDDDADGVPDTDDKAPLDATVDTKISDLSEDEEAETPMMYLILIIVLIVVVVLLLVMLMKKGSGAPTSPPPEPEPEPPMEEEIEEEA
jgi:hypothetical protein